jgi:hypothetical protein
MPEARETSGSYALEVPPFGGAQRADDALILGGSVALQARAKRSGVSGDAVDQHLVRWPIDQQQFGVFDRINEESTVRIARCAPCLCCR